MLAISFVLITLLLGAAQMQQQQSQGIAMCHGIMSQFFDD